MVRPTYSDAQKAEAVELYVEHGPSEASRRLGIPKGSITRWAKETGAETDRNAKTAAATEAVRTDNELRRARIQSLLLEKAEDLLERMDEPHVDFKGRDAGEVVYPKATSGDVKNYATSVGILIDKYRLEVGEVTDRSEVNHEGLPPRDEAAQRLAEVVSIEAARAA